ncbi:putative quinol monooxygenase [Marmoricola sp. RAF53]|uniref:putative quinol monooxygenase n=1 Tax=Marmoricola sp. RAF53 TaxID=3233059 RepID=UPI003F9DAD34
MTQLAVTIRHQTLPGRRDDVRKVWEAHMAPAISRNPGHLAYYYCLDNHDADAVLAFQIYDSLESSQAFLLTDAYAAYLQEVGPLLTGPPEVTALTPVFSKEP